MKSTFMRALGIFIVFTVLCGGVYTMAVTALSQVMFNRQANAGITEGKNGEQYTTMLGQKFTDEKHLWGREMLPSTVCFEKQGGEVLFYGGASNTSPASKEYGKTLDERIEKIKKANPDMGDTPVPIDLVTVSGSGLDPEISVEAAMYQVKRLAKANGKSEADIKAVIDRCTSGKTFGILGEKRVNVVKVNLMLDGIIDD